MDKTGRKEEAGKKKLEKKTGKEKAPGLSAPGACCDEGVAEGLDYWPDVLPPDEVVPPPTVNVLPEDDVDVLPEDVEPPDVLAPPGVKVDPPPVDPPAL
jgi:hypothetical protein